MGVRVEHSSLYNPGSQSGVERSIGSLKHLLKRSANMNQLQISEMVFALNTRIQTRFFGMDVTGNLPNSLNLDWHFLMENRRRDHQK